jgi:hypothetical protein
VWVCGCVGRLICWIDGACVCVCACVCTEEGGWLNSLCPSHALLFDRGGRASVAREHGRPEVILCVCVYFASVVQQCLPAPFQHARPSKETPKEK